MINNTKMPSAVPAPRKPVNYLNNKDMLKEIHASKNTWCSYTNPEDHRYDLIIDRADDGLLKNLKTVASKKTIAEARKIRAHRLGLTTRQVPVTDLVFRVMTWDHVPVAPKQPRKVDKKKSAKDIFDFDEDSDLLADLTELDGDAIVPAIDDMVHVRVNFPPFQHYRYDENDQLVCVGKSHWQGGLQNGWFNRDHGKMTPQLARMFIKLCERYGSKGNWRGYTYNDEMRSQALLQLSQVGLQFDESKSNNPFAYYTATITNSFTRVLNVEKRNQGLRDDILEMNSLQPSYTRQTDNAIKSAAEMIQPLPPGGETI
jgi:hypothetical protein